MKYRIKDWLRAAGIRALKTVAQTAVSMIPVGVSVEEVGWLAVLGTAALAGAGAGVMRARASATASFFCSASISSCRFAISSQIWSRNRSTSLRL